jgi:hypothetical protein
MIHADGRESVAGVPWRDDGEKETTHALFRALMRAGDVVAYSILTETWSAAQEESWKPREPLPIASNDVVTDGSPLKVHRPAPIWLAAAALPSITLARRA